MEKRYQVFVSSTFRDLQDERKEVMQALLELKCIPAGMELFLASDDDQWSLIKSVIDDCDYYVVIVGGRYGSTHPVSQISYTEMEYRYALEIGKPILGFVHREPQKLIGERLEDDPEKKQRLDHFRQLVMDKHVRFWTSAEQLGSVLSRSMINLISNTPAVGWIRSDQITPELSMEMLRLREDNDKLTRKLEAARTEAPAGTQELSQGDNTVEINYDIQYLPQPDDTKGKPFSFSQQSYNTARATFLVTWNRLFAHVAPSLMNEGSDLQIRKRVNQYLIEQETPRILALKLFQGAKLHSFSITDESLDTIFIQFRALGLIEKSKSKKARSVNDRNAYWTLTPYGDDVMIRLRAIRRKPISLLPEDAVDDDEPSAIDSV